MSELADDVNLPRAEEAARCGLHSAFAFPILQGKKLLGVMEFFDATMQEPDGPLLDTVAAIGSQVGQFIERMRTEEARQHSEERYRSLVLASSQVVWTTDGAGQLLLEDSSDWSTWLAFSGQTAEQAQGLGWLDAIHPDDRSRATEAWAQALASGRLGSWNTGYGRPRVNTDIRSPGAFPSRTPMGESGSGSARTPT